MYVYYLLFPFGVAPEDDKSDKNWLTLLFVFSTITIALLIVFTILVIAVIWTKRHRSRVSYMQSYCLNMSLVTYNSRITRCHHFLGLFLPLPQAVLRAIIIQILRFQQSTRLHYNSLPWHSTSLLDYSPLVQQRQMSSLN